MRTLQHVFAWTAVHFRSINIPVLQRALRNLEPSVTFCFRLHILPPSPVWLLFLCSSHLSLFLLSESWFASLRPLCAFPSKLFLRCFLCYPTLFFQTSLLKIITSSSDLPQFYVSAFAPSSSYSFSSVSACKIHMVISLCPYNLLGVSVLSFIIWFTEISGGLYLPSLHNSCH